MSDWKKETLEALVQLLDRVNLLKHGNLYDISELISDIGRLSQAVADDDEGDADYWLLEVQSEVNDHWR